MNQEKINKFKNKKIILGTTTIFSVIAIVFVISLFPFVLDPSRIFTTAWWTDEIILIVLTIISVVFTMYIGQASNGQDVRSNIAKAKVKFIVIIESINRSTFEQWVEQILEPSDQDKVYKRILREIGIKQENILTLSKSDLKSLIGNPQRINNVWFDEINFAQFKKIIEIKNGKYNIKFVDPGYYLSDKSIDIDLSKSERARNENKKHSKSLTLSLGFRIALVLIFSITIGMFTRDLLQQQDIATSLMKLFTRLSTMCSGCFAGYLTGCQDNDISASYIEMKVDVMKEQLADATFKAKSVEEIAKEKFELKVRIENENYMKKLQNNSDKLEMKETKI